jgi:hypothetical protein
VRLNAFYAAILNPQSSIFDLRSPKPPRGFSFLPAPSRLHLKGLLDALVSLKKAQPTKATKKTEKEG